MRVPRALPKSRAGWLSLGVALVGMVSFMAAMVGALSGQAGGDTLLDNPFLAATMLSAGTAAVAAGAIALYAIVRRRDRAIILFPVAWTALAAIVMVLGEIGGSD